MPALPGIVRPRAGCPRSQGCAAAGRMPALPGNNDSVAILSFVNLCYLFSVICYLLLRYERSSYLKSIRVLAELFDNGANVCTEIGID